MAGQGELVLFFREERTTASVIAEIDRMADESRDRETFAMILKGKIDPNDFDVFLCHNN